MSQAGPLLTSGGGGGTGTVTTVLAGNNISITGTPTVNPVVNVIGPPSPTSYTLDGVLYGNSTGPIQATAAGTTGQVLLAQTGSAPIWGSITLPPPVPTSFVENSGTAIPAENALNVIGSGAITTTGSGSTITITAPNVATSYVEGSGSAVPSGGMLNILGSGGITTSGSGNTVTITGSTPSDVPITFDENMGSATASSNILNVLGSGAITTTGSGSTITITAPNAVTSFQVDDNDTSIVSINAYGGTVTPASNIIRLGGDNGIVTNQTTIAGSIIIDFIRGFVTSTTGSTFTALTYTLNSNSVLTMQVIVCGRDTTSGASVGGYCTCVVKNVAGTASIVGTPDIILNSDSALAGATFTVGVSGASFVVQVIGVVGHTIDWGVALPGIVSDQ